MHRESKRVTTKSCALERQKMWEGERKREGERDVCLEMMQIFLIPWEPVAQPWYNLTIRIELYVYSSLALNH